MMHLKKIILKSQNSEPVDGSFQHSLDGSCGSETNKTGYLGNKYLADRENPLSLPFNKSLLPPPSPDQSLIPPTWINNFRDVYNENRHFAKHWFWDNFNWQTQSIWIGKFNKSNNLPNNNDQIVSFLQRLVTDLNRDPKIKSQVYLKFYFSRNVKTNDPEINYLLICNGTEVPEEFIGTLVDITFEKYQLTENILNKDKDFKRMLNHYLNWSNFYIYYNLMEELQY